VCLGFVDLFALYKCIKLKLNYILLFAFHYKNKMRKTRLASCFFVRSDCKACHMSRTVEQMVMRSIMSRNRFCM